MHRLVGCAISTGRPSEVPSDHASDEPGVAGIAPDQAPGFDRQPERPFQAALPKPAWGAADATGGEVDGRPDIGHHGNAQRVAIRR